MIEACAKCVDVQRRHRLLRHPGPINVRSHCAVCRHPVYLQVVVSYESTVRSFRAMNRVHMTHEVGGHTEAGGWGALWNLDAVLERVFPREYAEDKRRPFWPEVPFLNQGTSPPVDVIAGDLPPELRHGQMRSLMETQINDLPRSREELERLSDVWNEDELRKTFEVLGFMLPFVLVMRRADEGFGTVLRQDRPRLYWGFSRDRVI